MAGVKGLEPSILAETGHCICRYATPPPYFYGAPGTSRTCITELRRLLLIRFSYRGKVTAPLERFELPPPRSVVWCSISAELQGYLAGQGGLEPPISGFGVRCISHLCYCPAKKKIGQGVRIELT